MAGSRSYMGQPDGELLDIDDPAVTGRAPRLASMYSPGLSITVFVTSGSSRLPFE
jgi:hypothetical protein